MRDTDLHIYLKDKPNVETLSDLLTVFGFKYTKTVEATNFEPTTDFYTWKLSPISKSGLQLLFFHDLFPDDLNSGKFEAFIIICGDLESSDEDLVMVDIFSLLLLQRYGGKLHNPYRLDKISTSFLLSGKSFTGF